MRFFVVIGLLIAAWLLVRPTTQAQEPTEALGIRWVFALPDNGQFQGGGNYVIPRFDTGVEDYSYSYDLDDVTFAVAQTDTTPQSYELDIATGLPRLITDSDAEPTPEGEQRFGDLIIAGPEVIQNSSTNYHYTVHAANATTREVLWEFTRVAVSSTYRTHYYVTPKVVLIVLTDSEIYGEHPIYAHALDRITGEQLWNEVLAYTDQIYADDRYSYIVERCDIQVRDVYTEELVWEDDDSFGLSDCTIQVVADQGILYVARRLLGTTLNTLRIEAIDIGRDEELWRESINLQDQTDGSILLLRDQGVLAIAPWQEDDKTQAVRWQQTPNGLGARLENGSYYFFGEDDVDLLDAATGAELDFKDVAIFDPTLTVIQYNDKEMIAWGPTTASQTMTQAQRYLYQNEYDSAWLTLLWLSQTDKDGFYSANGRRMVGALGRQWLQQIEQALREPHAEVETSLASLDRTIPGLLAEQSSPYYGYIYDYGPYSLNYWIGDISVEEILRQMALTELLDHRDRVNNLIYAHEIQRDMRLLGWNQVENITTVDLRPLWWRQWSWRLVVPVALPLLYFAFMWRQANRRWWAGVVVVGVVALSYFAILSALTNGLDQDSNGPIAEFACLSLLVAFGYALVHRKLQNVSSLLGHAIVLFLVNGLVLGIVLSVPS